MRGSTHEDRTGLAATAARVAIACVVTLSPVGCLFEPQSGGDRQPGLRLNELVARNQGVWVDELGEADDYIELVNTSDGPLELADYSLSDASQRAALPDRTLGPGERLLLWADDDPEQGELHLPFKLSGDGETVTLFEDTVSIDVLRYGPLGENDAWLRLPDGVGEAVLCRYASPGRDNGEQCAPPEPPGLDDDVVFAPYAWPDGWAAPEGPLRITELALRPAAFIELHNASDTAVNLEGLSLRIAPHAPGVPWPGPADGIALSLVGTLSADRDAVASVTADDTAALEDDPAFEGVVTLFDADGTALDRVDFMRWPDGAVLARDIDGSSSRFCHDASEGRPNTTCDAVTARDVGDRVRHLRTPSDLTQLARGGSALGVESAKFVLDLQAGGVVHLLSAAAWPLHYTFAREQIDGDPPLDRCDPDDAALFYQGWVAFSQREYFVTQGRRFLLGTLSRHAGAGLHTVEFTPGDVIPAEQMRSAFFAVMPHVLQPTDWSLRPQDASQVARIRAIEGEAPIVGPNEPFRGLSLQPLTPGVGYGVLRFIPAAELSSAALGPDVIVVTDDVPNDIPLVGGLITEAFQTPLAHVNVLSRARNAPNMALRDAREHPQLEPYFDTLVRIEVGSGSFDVQAADPDQAEAFWSSRRNQGAPIAPRLDTDVRGVQPLAGRGLADLPSLGAKAAQLAELAPLAEVSSCAGGYRTPADAAAIPIVHSLEHYEASGAVARLAELRRDAAFRTDPIERAAGLAEVRALVLAYPVDRGLLAEVEQYVAAHFGDARVRFRSSSNTEDLAEFSGAGLYTSLSGALGDPERPIEDAIRIVWASLFNARAYDERQYANIDQARVGMGIVMHAAFLSERANGVAISRNLLDPTRGDAYYMNLQIGEASVTNPAPGVVTEQLLYNHTGRAPLLRHQSLSSLTDGPVMTDAELSQIACVLGEVHDHFQPLVDPLGENRWFAVDVELKRIGPERALVLKQARPYSFGQTDVPADCREFDG